MNTKLSPTGRRVY